MSAMATISITKVKLRLMIDKRANKVVFAEAGKDFVDLLFNLLSLPFTTVIRLLRNNAGNGCIGNLYQSLENLNQLAYLQPNQNKFEIIEPFKLNLTASVFHHIQSCPRTVFYKCPNTPQCTYGVMAHKWQQQQLNAVLDGDGGGGIGMMKKLVTFMVTDDLSVTPGSMISTINMLLGSVEDMGALTDRVVEIGSDEVLELLKTSLQSRAVLTTVFLMKKECNDEAVTTDKN